ncbi:hypothetical protein Bpfe_012956 [Biomphalaria pfeifferi]|uniref:Uncharacterized protein n=1 Tax=Biomphalaria pfeifferi TaxID=112525 RepID=A0AAD8FBV0_BIOPF|nr:hypothetical protein Bpfe_012956 [Biomphalaria pfeifferi]
MCNFHLIAANQFRAPQDISHDPEYGAKTGPCNLILSSKKYSFGKNGTDFDLVPSWSSDLGWMSSSMIKCFDFAIAK